LPIATYLFYAAPESLLFSYVGYGLLGIKVTGRQLLLHAGLYWLGGILVRSIEALFGWHMAVMLALYTVLGYLLIRVPLRTSFCAAALSFLSLALGEFLVAIPVITWLGWSTQSIVETATQGLVFGWLSNVPLIVLAIAIWRYDFMLLRLFGQRSQQE